MSEKIYELDNGQLNISNEVLSIICGIAANEVDGVVSISGGITSDMIHKLGIKRLSKGVFISVEDESVKVVLSLIIKNNYSIPEVSKNVQDKVRTAIENMTGFFVEEVNIKIAGICE